MKFTTYNFLTSKNIKGVKVGYPLKVTVAKKELVEMEFNPLFIERLLPRLEWATVRLAAQAVEMEDEIPVEQPVNIADDKRLLQKLHHLMLEIDVVEGHLECPETGRIFPIKNGIPNMLLNEDEV